MPKAEYEWELSLQGIKDFPVSSSFCFNGSKIECPYEGFPEMDAPRGSSILPPNLRHALPETYIVGSEALEFIESWNSVADCGHLKDLFTPGLAQGPYQSQRSRSRGFHISIYWFVAMATLSSPVAQPAKDCFALLRQSWASFTPSLCCPTRHNCGIEEREKR